MKLGPNFFNLHYHNVSIGCLVILYFRLIEEKEAVT